MKVPMSCRIAAISEQKTLARAQPMILMQKIKEFERDYV